MSRLTCSREAENHTAEEPGAHGSIRNPRLLLAVGRTPGVSGVSADPPASLIGAFAYDVTALCLCRLLLCTILLARTEGESSRPFLPFTAPEQGVGVKGASFPCPHMPTT